MHYHVFYRLLERVTYFYQLYSTHGQHVCCYHERAVGSSIRMYGLGQPGLAAKCSPQGNGTGGSRGG